MQKRLSSVILLLIILFLVIIGCHIEVVEKPPHPMPTTPPSAVKCVTDIQLMASNSSNPPAPPGGYRLIGYWDVDRGGARGTDGSTGAYMAGLYVK